MTSFEHSRVRSIMLAGVHAWRESPLDEVCSRPLLPLVGRPVFWHVLDWLSRGRIAEANVCANSQTQVFRRCLGDGLAAGIGVTYYEDLMPRGPAGCIRDVALSSDAETFLVTEASLIADFPVDQLVEAHASSGAAVTVVISPRRTADERPEELESAGIYVASRAAVEQIAPHGYQDIKEVWLPRLHQLGLPVLGFRVRRGDTQRITGMISYLAAMRSALERLPERAAGYVRRGGALVHVTANVASTAQLVGPLLIGPRSAVGEAATLVGPAVIGADCTIESEAVVCLSNLWSRSVVQAGAVVDRCVLPTGSRIESGLIARETVWRPEGARHIEPHELYWALAERGALARAAETPRNTGSRPPAERITAEGRYRSMQRELARHPDSAEPQKIRDPWALGTHHVE